MRKGLLSVAAALVVLWPLWSLAFDPLVSTTFTIGQPSTYCLDCHDGILAKSIHRGHAVDSNYLFAYSRTPGKLKPPGALDPAVYLDAGQIVCVTCHHPDSPHDSKLVLSSSASKLCVACHNQ